MTDQNRVDRMVAALACGRIATGDLDTIQREHVRIVETAHLLLAEVDRTEPVPEPLPAVFQRTISDQYPNGLSEHEGREQEKE